MVRSALDDVAHRHRAPRVPTARRSVRGLEGFLQDVGETPPRVHLDVHTDDLEAEVARLIGIGATEIARHGEWVVLSDPAGMAFCVCPVATDDPLLDGAPSYDD
ncbi:MAG TPA: VOC family protein [Acidimicrobiales bacterium]|nr:VOC family protein [Acidimicrobiales bacterium]